MISIEITLRTIFQQGFRIHCGYGNQTEDYEKMLDWKNECNGSKSLFLEGARRVGKSTMARCRMDDMIL